MTMVHDSFYNALLLAYLSYKTGSGYETLRKKTQIPIGCKDVKINVEEKS
jgi:hypothetical protein